LRYVCKLTYMCVKHENMTDLLHGYKIQIHNHFFFTLGGTLLFITCILLGILNPILFTQGWYLLSFVLYLIALAASPLLLRKEAKPINEFLVEYEGEEIPPLYYVLSKRLYLYEHITNVF